ncbi:hypothetical protein M8C21_023527, partial [Ambrosia artemisiifolia]
LSTLKSLCFLQAFFQRWWNQQSELLKSKVKELVNNGQLEFINGGMCMHDEATPHYVDLIDQTTMGHMFINKEFGQKPRVGWQIDPFGHSAVQAYLLGAEVGFDSLFFARMDYQDREKRKNEKTLEIVWQGSKSLGSSSQIFTGIFPRHYDPPDGFTFEINDVSPPIQDDHLLFDYNVQERVDDFVAAAIAQDGRVNALYSTPSIYTDAKYAANETWPLKTDDFFPYADKVNTYWTGYFTSRPNFKGYVRAMSGYYLAARQLEFYKGRNSSGPNTDVLADALAIAQHHDAVSGTQRQHVASDYTLRISKGYAKAEEVVASSLASLTALRSSGNREKSVGTLQQCPLINISYCPPSEAVLGDGKSLVIVVYNPIGWKREEVVRIPVSSHEIMVLDSDGKVIKSQLIPMFNHPLDNRYYHVQAYTGKIPSTTPQYWLGFTASVPPLGFSTYIVSSAKDTDTSDKTAVLGGGNLKLHFDTDQEKLTHYINNRSLVEESYEYSYSYYSGHNSTNQASGAYIFRPNGKFPIKPAGTINLGAYVEDGTTELSVLVDRAVGGSSLVDGQIELMLHRRLLFDDAKGVGEVLNETICVIDDCKGLVVQGKYYVRIDPMGDGAKWRRTFGQEIYSPLLLAFAEQDGNDWINSHASSFSMIDASYSLPINTAIITLQELESGTVLLRLAHLYEVGEDKDYSGMASVELKKLFPNRKISKVTEMNLSGNQERDEMEKKRLNWKVKDSSEAKIVRGGVVDSEKLVVELGPMEIRTFFVDFDYLRMFASE